jgi:hypothetical protein
MIAVITSVPRYVTDIDPSPDQTEIEKAPVSFLKPVLKVNGIALNSSITSTAHLGANTNSNPSGSKYSFKGAGLLLSMENVFVFMLSARCRPSP